MRGMATSLSDARDAGDPARDRRLRSAARVAACEQGPWTGASGRARASLLEYFPLTTSAMRRAAEFWAQARREGRPTADDKALDGDVILAAQAMTLGVTDVMIAMTNVAHLSRFAPAALWTDIASPSP